MPEVPGPSTFTPFFRRFTDERARDLSDLRALHREIRALHYASPYSEERAIYKIGADLYRKCEELFPEDILTPIAGLMSAITCLERPIFEFPEIKWDIAHLTLKEHVDLNHFLTAKQYFHAHQERVIAEFKEGLEALVTVLTYGIPTTLGPSPFNIPIMNTLNEPNLMIDRLYEIVCSEKYIGTGLFAELRERTYANLCKASGVLPHSEHKRSLKHAMDVKAPINELVDTYLTGTPFVDYLYSPIPLKLTYEDRFSHMHILGGSGAGKTQLLQHLILHDLQSEEPPSLVIVDSQGDLIDKLSHLALFDPDHGVLASRLLLITPKDIQHPPALNIFDLNRERLGRYDEVAKEQVVAGVIQTFDYLFAGLLGADLTAKQGVFFRFVARLMLAIPETMGRNATILDMIDLMDDPEPYRKAIESLPAIQRNFFERDFISRPGKKNTFEQTKEQIRYRLNAILENPTLARLFTAPETKVDLFDVLNNGGIVLVDTAKDFLKGSSAHFGRIFISLVLQAVLERAAIPEAKRRPTFLIVDEAAAYFDSNIDDFLTEARKYKCGCVFAHQFLDQAASSLRASLAANTSIKMASGVSTNDARALAPDMRTTQDFILSQPRLHFACHIRNITPNAVSVPISAGELESQSRLTNEAYERLRERNRRRVSLPQPIRRESVPLAPGQNPSPVDTQRPGRQEPRPASQPPDDPSAPSEDW